jgi:hypothetical protein
LLLLVLVVMPKFHDIHGDGGCCCCSLVVDCVQGLIWKLIFSACCCWL